MLQSCVDYTNIFCVSTFVLLCPENYKKFIKQPGKTYSFLGKMPGKKALICQISWKIENYFLWPPCLL